MFERRYPAAAWSGPWKISRQPCAMGIAFRILSLGSAKEQYEAKQRSTLTERPSALSCIAYILAKATTVRLILLV
jgi:hypothetical protein